MNKKSFVSTDPSNHNSENTWFTPKEIINLFPVFDLDPCTVKYSPFKTAKHSFFYDDNECGLVLNWFGDVWLNPPYGKKLKPFVDKFMNHKKGVMLLFARMGNESIQKLINDGAYFYFLRKRLRFIRKDEGKSTNAGTDNCFIFYDKKYIQYCKKLDGKLMKGGF